jgi:predicted dehydrogenase
MVHAPILANHPDTELVGVWARRPEAAQRLAERNGTASYSDYAALLDDVEAVAFCVPPNVQADMAVTAAKAGKAVLLEKPLALDLDAAQRLSDAIDEAGVGSVVLLSMRFAQPTKDFLRQSAEIGAPLGGRVAWVSGAFKEGSPFATPWRLENGPLPDLGPHAIDLIDAALGSVVDVTAATIANGWVSVILEHENGTTSTLNLCASSATTVNVAAVEVYGTDGAALFDASKAADSTSMMAVPTALAAAARGEATDAPDVHRGLHLQRIISKIAAKL